MLDAPTSLPPRLLMGDMVIEIGTIRPSRWRRVVWKGSIRSPSFSRRRISASSSRLSSREGREHWRVNPAVYSHPSRGMSDPEIQAKFSALVVVCMLCAISTGQVHAEIRPVRDVQKALADQGFDAGTPDGIWGSKSVAALKGFQRAHRLAPSGVVTQDSLKALFPSSNTDAQPAALPADVVAVPIVPLVDPKPKVLSSEPVSLSPQVS
ncbi:peptidoglycan-binding domain-containing protein (plasmid) [Rhizobium leguminosarum]